VPYVPLLAVFLQVADPLREHLTAAPSVDILVGIAGDTAHFAVGLLTVLRNVDATALVDVLCAALKPLEEQVLVGQPAWHVLAYPKPRVCVPMLLLPRASCCGQRSSLHVGRVVGRLSVLPAVTLCVHR
jgi:hypothetical protein